MYLQLNEILLLRKLTSEEVREPKFPERETKLEELTNCLRQGKLELKRNEKRIYFYSGPHSQQNRKAYRCQKIDWSEITNNDGHAKSCR